tara:strand:+ start:45 stop:473 length:429 start_codon:yes stop_codon:yes gene_type:complete
MAFKLGSERKNTAINGHVSKKMRFGKQAGDPDISVPGTPVIRKKLEGGVGGEANMDGSIYISDKIQPGSWDEKITINHEMRHATDIKIGKLKYADDHIKYNGVTYPRQNIQGQDMILVEGNWLPAGYPNFPWEHDANNGNPV